MKITTVGIDLAKNVRDGVSVPVAQKEIDHATA